MPVLVHCYNKGCGQKFDPEKNDSDVCQYHPGEPIFHDAKKKWSCCNKFSTDFTEFLNIKGCTMGKHNGVKPAEPSKPESSAKPNVVSESVPVAPKTLPPPISTSQPRPVSTEPMKQLRVVIAPSLLLMLEKLSLTNGPQNTDKTEQNGGKVIPGTTCKNSGCKAVSNFSNQVVYTIATTAQ
ncbi:Cysteine and histidine-rich domain-containing protein 1 [Fasciola gigantica]|uniref:Cysteine and histidine-rich domain-containing protein 1 n=1 Tax=Fasciola gigantica TaxID=46835 RepID=A0A504YM56_FASGI|nr:Cysteine and histidine-rich domain-containing protein 1 [Fasciola gigantica]